MCGIGGIININNSKIDPEIHVLVAGSKCENVCKEVGAVPLVKKVLWALCTIVCPLWPGGDYPAPEASECRGAVHLRVQLHEPLRRTARQSQWRSALSVGTRRGAAAARRRRACAAGAASR